MENLQATMQNLAIQRRPAFDHGAKSKGSADGSREGSAADCSMLASDHHPRRRRQKQQQREEEGNQDYGTELTESVEMSGRERLRRHRNEVAGRVCIPEEWGQEEFLRDWIDGSAFDSSLIPDGLTAARAALIRGGGGGRKGV